jgi:hypothetical protein
MDGDNELSHRAHFGGHLVRPELGNGERNGFIKRFCLYINVMGIPFVSVNETLQRFMEAL